MAIHHQLPIYKVAYNLADLAIDLIKNMPREVKAVIGSELRDECLRLLVLIFRANVATDKRAHLTQLIERQQVVELRRERASYQIRYSKYSNTCGHCQP